MVDQPLALAMMPLGRILLNPSHHHLTNSNLPPLASTFILMDTIYNLVFKCGMEKNIFIRNG